MLLSTITLLAAIAATAEEKAEIPVHNVSAQYVNDYIKLDGRFDPGLSNQERSKRGLVPNGVTIHVTPGRNSITAIGTDEGIHEITRIIAMFDKKPRPIEVEMTATAPLIGREFKHSSTIVNNTALDYSDGSSDTEIKFLPRINGDDTVTVSITAGTLGYVQSFIVRVKSGETVFGLVRPEPVTNESGDTPKSELRLTYTTRRIDQQEFLYSENPTKLLNEWFLQSPYGKLVSEQVNPPIEAELRFIVKVTIPESRD